MLKNDKHSVFPYGSYCGRHVSKELKAKTDFKAGADRMQATIDDPSKSDRTKIESKMIKAILEFDDHEFERTSNILKRMDKVGLKVVEVKK